MQFSDRERKTITSAPRSGAVHFKSLCCEHRKPPVLAGSGDSRALVLQGRANFYSIVALFLLL